MAQKRRTKGGRVTPSKKTLARTATAATTSSARSPSPGGARRAEREDVAPSSRYTPAKPNFRTRPRWHRFAGWFGVLLGLTLAVVNDAMLFMEDGKLLPFGHQEFYLLLALAVAGSSTWFLGLFDRGTTVYD